MLNSNRFGCLQCGSGLIEILVTVLVVSVGLLGMASLQLKSMSLNHTAYQRLQAVNLAYEMA
ncbi:MAG: type IV pilus modification protein PilV, partial [Pseudomonadales bacterium]|nr:type IV pilus modification protein PilV [Pseudomonadales bacterium]